MRMVDLIQNKRDGFKHNEEEIHYIVKNYVGRDMKLSCKLEDGNEINVMLRRKMLVFVSATVYVNNLQVGYVKDIYEKNNTK